MILVRLKYDYNYCYYYENNFKKNCSLKTTSLEYATEFYVEQEENCERVRELEKKINNSIFWARVSTAWVTIHVIIFIIMAIFAVLKP